MMASRSWPCPSSTVQLAFNLVHEAGRRQILHLAANLVHLAANLVRRQKLSTFPRQQPSPPLPPQPLLDARKRKPRPQQQLELLLCIAFNALAYNLQVREGACKQKGEEFGSAALQIDQFQVVGKVIVELPAAAIAVLLLLLQFVALLLQLPTLLAVLLLLQINRGGDDSS